METRASYFAVGMFVIACFVALLVSALWLTGAQYRQEFSYYLTYFNGAVTGLGRGTVVRYNGIDAGRVTNLAFDEADPKRVFVTLQIDKSLKLHVDSVASMESQGITGGTYVEITGGTASAPLLKPEAGQSYPVIASKASTLEQLAEAGPELVGHFNTVGERLSDRLNDDNRKALSEMLASLRNLTVALDHHSDDIDATLANLKVATAGMTNTLQSVDHTLAGADKALDSINTAAGALNGTLASASATMLKFGQLSDDTDKVVSGSGVAQLTQLVGQTRALISALTRLTNDVEREPTKIIYGDQREGYTPK